jgi:hypothetical protein
MSVLFLWPIFMALIYVIGTNFLERAYFPLALTREVMDGESPWHVKIHTHRAPACSPSYSGSRDQVDL